MIESIDSVISGSKPYVVVGRDSLPAKALLLPGSFNPLHRGHLELLQAAEQQSGRKGLLELSVTNVDKPVLEAEEVERRIQQISNGHSIVLTRAATFAEKAELFPDAWFALGYDTAVRLLDPAYHADRPAMLSRFSELGTRLLVGGRLHDGTFRTLEGLKIPAEFSELFIPIPAELFRVDISSTDLRGRSTS